MTLKLNKYLKELGLTEESYPFNKVENDKRYEEDEDGFKDMEFFSLDYTLSLYIYSQLCYFREHCLCGYSGYFQYKYKERAAEKWQEVIDDMIEAFRLLIIEDNTYQWYQSKKENYILSKNRKKKINKGLRYFIKYYNDLWY